MMKGALMFAEAEVLPVVALQLAPGGWEPSET